MLTIKKLDNKLKEIEKKLTKLTKPIKNVEYIARTYLYTNDNEKNYEDEKENLIKKGFKLIKTEEANTLLYHLWGKYGNKETWEKKYAEGEF